MGGKKEQDKKNFGYGYNFNVIFLQSFEFRVIHTESATSSSLMGPSSNKGEVAL